MFANLFTRKATPAVETALVHEGPITYRAAQDEAHSLCSPYSHSATDHFLSRTEGCWLLDD